MDSAFAWAGLMLIVLVIYFVPKIDDYASKTNGRFLEFVLSAGNVVLILFLIHAIQHLFGGLEYVADGAMEIGFPYIFYAATPWSDPARFSQNDLIANVQFGVAASLAFGAYRAFRKRDRSA